NVLPSGVMRYSSKAREGMPPSQPEGLMSLSAETVSFFASDSRRKDKISSEISTSMGAILFRMASS
ncbi:MAG: hypothetical protein R6V39_08620, partial [Desulfovibrionales bacterium]